MIQLKVAGMTCDHCATAVTRAIRRVDPRADVKVDLGASTVLVGSEASRGPSPSRSRGLSRRTGYGG